ncbi:transporter [uncultured Gemmiger sp.]|uniref:transporter n=1 Tax=uncultured Gemmiger sp. TaxID=1623490 RepID=UPI0025D8AD2E|nr:transporter [uncultured Gemmiger sp.]
MAEPPRKRRLTRPQLHRYEERIKYALRDQVAELAGFVEVIISVLVLIGLLISAVPVAREMITLWGDGSTSAFQPFLSHAFNLVIGIEFIKMLAKHSPGSALEVLLYAIARNMILDHGTAMANLLGVLSIGLIFVIRKFFFVPSFGATLPGGEMADDVKAVFGSKKPIKAGESKDAPANAKPDAPSPETAQSQPATEESHSV